jgi:hypothetical protein
MKAQLMQNKMVLEEEGLYRQHSQLNNSCKNREYNIKTHLVFVDHVKTSDLVLQTNKLWENSE